MILKKIKLENIRSYQNEKIDFPEGSLLLSGDIGSGKSTVLLAIDFALFGLRKKELSGSSLLRHGEKTGSVELSFILNNKEVTVKRTLKKSKDSVLQDSGFIIIDGEKKHGTAIELKQSILNLLNYPEELLTKNKSLIFKYTVYTPQEEMKHILTADRDIRLDILRKVFGIDKYKRIKENSKTVVYKIKEKIKEKEGNIYDLEDFKKQKKEKEILLDEVNKKILLLDPEVEKIRNLILTRKNLIKDLEDKINQYNNLKKELELSDVKLNNKIEQNSRNKKELEILDEEIKSIEKLKLDDSLIENIENNKKELENLTNILRKINTELTNFETKKENSEDIKHKINELNNCPICKQEVSLEHKMKVKENENKKINEFSEKIKLLEKQERETEDKIRKTKINLVSLDIKKEKFLEIKLKIESLRNKKQRKELLLKEQSMIKNKIGEINLKKKEASNKLELYKNIEKKYKKEKEFFDIFLNKERELSIELATLKKELNGTKEFIEKLNENINLKLKIKKEVRNLKDIKNWLEDYFFNLMDSMERQIMLRIYTDFDELFKKWFLNLIDDEHLKVRLGDDFTPIIEQNGYETDYLHLSGGEKTAAALAYRLSLNQIIINLMTKINTKGLVILDEPTDGFSSDQLDNMRFVLDELNAKQLIIVSHESKIESFVDNIIRFEKKDHISKAISL